MGFFDIVKFLHQKQCIKHPDGEQISLHQNIAFGGGVINSPSDCGAGSLTGFISTSLAVVNVLAVTNAIIKGNFFISVSPTCYAAVLPFNRSELLIWLIVPMVYPTIFAFFVYIFLVVKVR